MALNRLIILIIYRFKNNNINQICISNIHYDNIIKSYRKYFDVSPGTCSNNCIFKSAVYIAA